jgi:hypothetical protein
MRQGQKNWEYSHVDQAWPICHAFLPLDKEFNNTPMLKQKLGAIQDVECNNHLRGGIVNVYNAYDTSWIVAMQKLGYKYACIWFEGCWPDQEDFNINLLAEIDDYNREDPHWIVAGQLKQHDDFYPYFTRTFIILNIAKWEEKRPGPFWQSAHHPGWINIEPDKNHEDSEYRLNADPEWMFADGFNGSFMWQHNYGACWVQFSFIQNMTVWGISNELVDQLFLTQAWYNSTEYEKAITGQKYDEKSVHSQCNRLVKRMFEPTSPVYFVNTEPASPTISPQALDVGFDQYVGCTAGFKLLYYAYKYGMTENTCFVWFDFDADSVQFKRDTIKHWNGEDFPKWVDMWVHAHPGCNDRLVTMAHERWSIVIDYFDGPVAWLEFWNKVKQCDHQYFNIDLIYEHSEMFKQIKNKKTLFWSSNIYSYITPKLMAKPFALEKSFIEMIEKVCSTHEDSWFSGTDINDNDLMCPANVVLSATDNRGIGLE